MANERDGAIEPNQGSLYLVDNDLKLTRAYSPVSISNGMAWNAAGDIMYYIDFPTNEIWSFDYNLDKGTISKYTN